MTQPKQFQLGKAVFKHKRGRASLASLYCLSTHHCSSALIKTKPAIPLTAEAPSDGALDLQQVQRTNGHRIINDGKDL